MRKVTGGAAAVKGDAAAVAVLEVACIVLLNVLGAAGADPREAAIEARANRSRWPSAPAPPGSRCRAATCALLTIANGEGAAAGARAQAAVDAGCLAPLAAAMGAHADIAAMAEGAEGALRAHRRLRRAPGGGGGRLHEGRRRRARKVRRRDDGARGADHVLDDGKEDVVAAGAKETRLCGGSSDVSTSASHYVDYESRANRTCAV